MKESFEDKQNNRVEQSPKGAFSNLPPRVEELLLDALTGGIDFDRLFKVLEGVPGRDNFYKRLRTGMMVRVLRSDGTMDDEGWTIEPGPQKSELGNGAIVRVHNEKQHREKSVPLEDLIRWNL